MHPEHLRVAGRVGTEGTLVAEEVLPVQVQGGYTPATLSPDTQIDRGRAGIKRRGSSREVSGRSGGAVQPLEKGFL